MSQRSEPTQKEGAQDASREPAMRDTCHAGQCIMYDMRTILNLAHICTKTRQVITRLR